jgi:hypothetical protein
VPGIESGTGAVIKESFKTSQLPGAAPLRAPERFANSQKTRSAGLFAHMPRSPYIYGEIRFRIPAGSNPV